LHAGKPSAKSALDECHRRKIELPGLKSNIRGKLSGIRGPARKVAHGMAHGSPGDDDPPLALIVSLLSRLSDAELDEVAAAVDAETRRRSALA